ncbi:hypothetical protein ABZ671_00595 [Micromonospora sp. NPDC006766]|uniref:hypothetical protein n=1 Tax=Micromonospora sp. NPDC006766 TaxID=3154778 RepID=UPI0033F0CD8D
MVVLLPQTAPNRPDTNTPGEVEHYYCCDENVAMCGLDLTGAPEVEPGGGPVCPLCHLAWDEGRPCPVPGCRP